MRYRVDLTLNAKQSIDVFRQTLRNDSDVPVTVSLTNITKNELVRNIDFLINNSARLITEGVMPEGANGIVNFKVYDNPKKIGGRRNITFSNSINKNDYLCKFIDSEETDATETSFLDVKHDISMYLRYAGNPEIVLSQGLKSPSVTEQEPVEEEKVEETETEPVEEEKVEETETEPVEEEKVASLAGKAKSYSKGEDGKFYCPFEECEKHKEGYATERAMKNHMIKVHNVEC